jgi:RNA polymerase subunit RPABC4/transcription elongation factor Spt4
MEAKMAIFRQKCPNCGQIASRDAQFCPNCGGSLAGGTRICGVCNTENRSDAKYCKKCGSSLESSEAPEIRSHRWARHKDDFATRVETDDLTGLFKRGLQIDPGTNALLVYQGRVVDTVAPGVYTLETIPQHLTNWIRDLAGGVPKQVTALLVDITPAELEFQLGGRFTQDDLPIGISIRLQAEVRDAGKFLVNMLKSDVRLSMEDLRAYLYPEIVQTTDKWLRQHTLEQLVEDYSVRQKLELDLEEALRTTFAQSGLHFLYVRTVELNLEPYDHIKGVRGKYALQVAEFKADAQGKRTLYEVESGAEIDIAQARLKARQKLLELGKQVDLVEQAEEARKVEQEEKKAGLYELMLEVVKQKKMAEVRSEADFEAFLDQMDREKLLREKERQELLRTWKETAEDHELAHRHLLSKLEIERKSELNLAALKLQYDQDQQKLESEIELGRKTAEFRWAMERRQLQEELENERARAEVARKKAQITDEIERLQIARDRDEALMAIELLGKMKEIRRLDDEEKLRIEREDWLARQRAGMEIKIQEFEIEERHRQAEREYELARIREIAKVSVEHLIVLSSPEQAQILADLKRTEALKGMSEEQILALAAEHSPEVARAFQEKYRALANRETDTRERELYERLMGENKEILRQMLAEADKSAQRIQEMANHAMDRMAETAQAYARGGAQTPPVIIMPGSGTSQVVPGGLEAGQQGEAAGYKLCPNCGRFVSVDAHHCEYCGHKFEGVG